MEFLNKQLAQEIVDRTMGIIGRNINVMDNRGVIIGSGDIGRIDDIHEGAEMVIKHGFGFDISEEEAEKLHGAKAGINLPITFEGKIVGVIGITGPPDEIRSYGELVKMAAELSLQQAVLINEIQWDDRLKEELVSTIIHSTGEFNSLFHERSKRLGIDLELPRVAMVLLTSDRKKTFSILKNRLEKEDLYLLQQDRIIILKKISSLDRTAILTFLKRSASSWINTIKTSVNLEVKIGIGDYHQGFSGLAKSYEQAANALHTGMKVHPAHAIYPFTDYYLPVFLWKATDAGMTEELPPLYEMLSKQDAKGELSVTFRAIIETDGDMNAAAKKLFIHRNTLRYRLDKITKITGKDPRKMTDLLYLYLSYLLHEIN